MAEQREHIIYGSIEVRGARENNLRNVSVDIPKRQLTVFTGVSGSGKSSLVFGTIAAESQRLLNETYTAFIQSLLPSLGRPDVDSLANLSAAIIVDQQRMGGNSRSTVGTVTDAYAMLRFLYARLGRPNLGTVSAFSFNDPQGACPDCEGSGQAWIFDLEALVDRSKSLNEGPINFPGFDVDGWPWTIFAESGYFAKDLPLEAYTDEQWQRFLHGPDVKIKAQKMNLTYEGLISKIKRLYLSKDLDQLQPHVRAGVLAVAQFEHCPACGGSRLNEAARTSLIEGVPIQDCAAMQASDLAIFVRSLDAPDLKPMITGLLAVLDNLVHIGLGYLSLDRVCSSLSGGESQRVKMVRHLGSPLTDLTYIFDEPTIGLHPHDVERFNELLLLLRDKGNSVLVVEHKPSVIVIADHIVDMGPGAGVRGGHVVFEGSVEELRRSDSLTGRHLGTRQAIKDTFRTPTGALRIEGASTHNLRDVNVEIPTGVLTVVTGVAGSGKSSLIRGSLPGICPEAVIIDQTVTRGSRRSNPATYTSILDPIRKAFAKANGVKEALFSANSAGACPECKGLGLVYTDLMFMESFASVCPECGGKRFTAEVLGYTLRGQTISDVLEMSVAAAADFFTEKAIVATLTSLTTVGLDYLSLGQPLSSLSGGERQRLKLAIEMAKPSQTYVLDEPTSGLHMNDVDNLIGLLDNLVAVGNTVIVIEHNLDVIARADWVIDLGPGAGHDGGRVIFEGTPADLVREDSPTGTYLARHLAG